MPVSIINSNPATPEEWDRAWQSCPYSTFYHSHDWADLWQRYTSGKMYPSPLKIEFSDRKTLILPFSKQKLAGGLINRCISSVPHDVTYGGWISADKLTIDHISVTIAYLKKNFKNLIWRLNPYDELLHRNEISTEDAGTTNVISLKDGMDAIFRNFSKGHRNAVKNAQKNGITVRPGESPEDWKCYHNMYLDCLKRWGKKAFAVHSWRLFEIMARMESPYIRLWLAGHNGRQVAGRIVVYSKNNAISWHGSCLKNYFYLRPVHLLHFEIMKNCLDEGYQWYDFGPSGKLAGVREFKRHFGTIDMPCGKIRLSSPLQSVIRKGFKLACRVTGRRPV